MNAFDLKDGYFNLKNQHDVETSAPFSTIHSKEEEVLDSNQDVILEPIQSESYDLSYTCLLIPRFPFHQLKGDLAEYAPQWLQQICISYGWQLESITVLPDYFQWVLHVSPSIPPGHFIQIIRSETSKLILFNFGHIRRENLSSDFWAPGYLVVLGARPHPKEMIEQYIRLTRRQQGLQSL